MTNQGSILVLMEQGVSVSWLAVSYHGPFTSHEERDNWTQTHPPGKGRKYVVEYLSK